MGANLAQLLSGLLGPQAQGPVQTQQPGNVVAPVQQQNPLGGLLGAAPQVPVPQQQFDTKRQLSALAALLAINPQAGQAALGLKQQNVQNIQQAQRTNVGLRSNFNLEQVRQQRADEKEQRTASREDRLLADEKQTRRFREIERKLEDDSGLGIFPDETSPILRELPESRRIAAVGRAKRRATRARELQRTEDTKATAFEKQASATTAGTISTLITGTFDSELLSETMTAFRSGGEEQALSLLDTARDELLQTIDIEVGNGLLFKSAAMIQKDRVLKEYQKQRGALLKAIADAKRPRKPSIFDPTREEQATRSATGSIIRQLLGIPGPVGSEQ